MGLQGYGVKQDAGLGIKWLRRAVEKSHPDALCEMSACCMFGLGVNKDLRRALQLADEALKQVSCHDGCLELELVLYIGGLLVGHMPSVCSVWHE